MAEAEPFGVNFARRLKSTARIYRCVDFISDL
jgi:hypothetical protein